ncbi:MAG: hypothetical protein DWH97_11130 [Planctomycetota bacterium]|nr:MAG: hypothetical protein DWH97_11130 [Planctomycetota bacterium]
MSVSSVRSSSSKSPESTTASRVIIRIVGGTHTSLRTTESCRDHATTRPPLADELTMTTTDPAPQSVRTPRDLVGLALLHGGVAAWVGYGVVVKAVEFNPQLLPPPILQSLLWFARSTSVDASAFIEWSFRAILGVEVFIVLAVLCSIRYARVIAIATLSFFCLVLLIAMSMAGMKDGLSAALTGSCGCFGEKGFPASVMLLIDGVLLANAIFLAPRPRRGGTTALYAAMVIGAIAIFAIPERHVATPVPVDSAVSDPTATDTQIPASNAITGPWPAVPATWEKNYFPKWKEWIGKPFREQKLALAIDRPMPVDLEQGDWLITFSRWDCDHCQEMYRAHFAKPRAEKIMKVSIPDTTGRPLPMPCVGCVDKLLFRVKAGETGRSPNYLIQTPIIVRLKDGIVTAVCTDVDNVQELNAILNETIVEPAPPIATNIPPTNTAKSWPGPPAQLDAFYIAEFAGTEGKPFSDNSFARLIAGTIPADFLTGRWIVIFFREDCEHCHELLSTYFTGKLSVRTMTIAIPDADPNNINQNPCDACAKLSMIKGPNYVIGTPVVLAINDGVVECVIEDAEDMAALEACMKLTAP